jgi:enoyl-[acyl-carrier protein] reductase II
VVSNTKFAQKCEAVGVDAIVAEGFEAGGHNGREETTTMCLIPMVREACKLPLIAAGGVGSGKAMAAAFCLGADAVQVGSRFAATAESSAHPSFKQAIVQASDGDTQLTLKELTPVRLLKNKFYRDVMEAYNKDASADELAALLGRGRAKKGMFEGDMDEGELEIGQVSATIHNVKQAGDVVHEMLEEYRQTLAGLKPL